MNKATLLTLCFLSFQGFAHAMDDGPSRAPGMMNEDAHRGPPPQEDLSNLKFEYDSKNDLFKNADEAKEYQALFDKYKTSKEISERFTKIGDDQRSKMDDMRKSGKRPDFAKMQEERDTLKFNLIKELKTILEKKKKDNAASLALNEDVKCGGGKNPLVIEKATTDSMKDTSKVAKIILTEDELNKMKKDIKEEAKKEVMKEMADHKPKDDKNDKDEFRGGGDRPSKGGDRDDDEKPKMAEGKNKRQMPGGGGGSRGGNDSSNGFSLAGEMSNQMMGNSQMGGGMQMNQNQNQMGNSQNMNQGSSQYINQSRDQMMFNAIRVPQMNFNQPFASQNQMGGNQMNGMQMQQGQMGNNQMGGMQMQQGQMGNNQMGGMLLQQGQMNQNQMGPPPMPMNQNQNQNYGYAYQSNTDQNYGMMNSQNNYNLMAPPMNYGYTGTTSMPSAAYSGQYYGQVQMPSSTQYSFMGY